MSLALPSDIYEPNWWSKRSLDREKEQLFVCGKQRRLNKESIKGKGFRSLFRSMDRKYILSMNTRQVVDMRNQNIPMVSKPKVFKREYHHYVVITGVSCGIEIQMVRSISGKLQLKQYFREKNQSTRRSINILNVGRCK